VAITRLSKEQFFDRLAGMDDAALKKALWTLYWQGTASSQERIAAVTAPNGQGGRRPVLKTRPDPPAVLDEVTEFATLARAGAYLAGDRRVSPKERTRWRHTFKRLAADALNALGDENVDSGALATATLIDLACEMQHYDYFRSEDPVEASRFVVSDAAAALWSAVRRERGITGFSEHAAGQLLRWESRFGWTRRGEGWVSQRERSLAQVVAGLLPVADAWGEFADHYLRALDTAWVGGRAARTRGVTNRTRPEELSEWHAMLVDRLVDSAYEDRLDHLIDHPAFVMEHRFVSNRPARPDG
jgi:hypothetical protein